MNLSNINNLQTYNLCILAEDFIYIFFKLPKIMLQERPAGVEPPGVPPGYPPDLETLILEVVKKKAFPKEKKIIRFSDLPDEGPPGETVSMIL